MNDWGDDAFFVHQKRLDDSPGIDVEAHHLTAVVDVEDGGQRGALGIDRGEDSLVPQESMPRRDIARDIGAEVDDLPRSACLGRRWCRRRLSPHWL
jgi:hypothetical protein